MQNKKFKLKAEISKKGEMIYFSQLDLLLVLKRALRRSGLPNYFTQGFRPHIKISFQRALKLGCEGTIEAAFYFNREIEKDEFADKLNQKLPEGLKVHPL